MDRRNSSSLTGVRIIGAVAACLLPFLSAIAQEFLSPEKELEKLQAQFEGARDLLFQRIRNLNRNYTCALGKVLDAESAAGRLDGSGEGGT